MSSEFDPEIMKRSLPPDVQGIINQVTQNVNLAVAKIVDEFKDKAVDAVKSFANHEYSADLESAIARSTSDLQAELNQFESELELLRGNAAKAVQAANAAQSSELKRAADDLNRQAQALQTRLKAFKEKTDLFGRKIGGAIATAAVKTFTGGIG